MSTPADSIIANWNRSFRGWSENYTKPYRSSIIKNCLFEDVEIEKGHSSALRAMNKNKGNISKFVLENTEEKYHRLLPSKMLSDTYSFSENEYKMVHKSCLDKLIEWKPGTSNALSKHPLDIHYGTEHFECKWRKYQLESMKKFIQATPGTKEIRGQWSVNLPNDSMMISFGHNNNVVVIIKIGCFYDKLNIMYQENGALRKNSKIRKQTLKTSCFGLEKTRSSSRFDNSIIIQENYTVDICAKNVLSISPIIVYVRGNLMYNTLRINHIDINLNKAPFHIANIVVPALNHAEEQHLRLKYRNALLNGNKSKTVNNCKNDDDDDDLTDFYPIKPKKETSLSPISLIPLDDPMDQWLLDNPLNTPCFNNPFNYDMFNDSNYSLNNHNMNEMERLRQENEELLQRVTEQQRQIDFLAAQIESMQSIHSPFSFYNDYGQRHNPLKRRRISRESLLPPAA